jgi:hypothetical protein
MMESAEWRVLTGVVIPSHEIVFGLLWVVKPQH